MTSLLGALVGAGAGLGAVLVIVGLRGAMPSLVSRKKTWWPSDRVLVRTACGLVAFIVVAIGTGWIVGSVIAGAGAAAAPSMLGAKARRARAVARIEGIAAWAEQLRDVMASAGGIQEAIVATGPLAPAPIAAEVRRLADRLAVRNDRLAPALRAFADEVAHPLGDMVVTSLLLASERQGRLGDLLSEVARSARQTATSRMRIEAARARTYVTTRLIIGITVAITVWLVAFRRDYLDPFDTAGGQVMLAVIGATFLGSGLLMQRMADPTEPARLLTPVDAPSEAPR